MKEKELHSKFAFQIEPKHYYKHNYLTYCNDTLVSILKYADKEKLSTVTIEFKSENDAVAFERIKNNTDEWQDWLLQNGYKDILYESYFRHTLFSLVADFCHYMLESINCAAKMKVAVSYALLRKPLKDTLGYLEWLYVNRNEMIDLLENGTPEDLIISKEKAREHTSKIEQEHGTDGYFQFRYDKSSEMSLEHIWNNANHLITTRYKYSKTAQGNLNFIFADEEMLRKFSNYYYLMVPFIMSYTVDLICEMFEEFAPINKYTKVMNGLNRVMRTTEMTEDITFENAKKFYYDFDIPIICPRCGLKMKITDRRVMKLLSGKITCYRCLKSVKTGRYIFDWENIEIVDNVETQ